MRRFLAARTFSMAERFMNVSAQNLNSPISFIWFSVNFGVLLTHFSIFSNLPLVFEQSQVLSVVKTNLNINLKGFLATVRAGDRGIFSNFKVIYANTRSRFLNSSMKVRSVETWRRFLTAL